jgi:hypothetical protein
MICQRNVKNVGLTQFRWPEKTTRHCIDNAQAMIEGVAPGSLFLNLQMLLAQRAQPLVGTSIAPVRISNRTGLYAEFLF